MTQTQIVRRWFDELWNEGHEAVIDELLAPGMVARGLAATDIVGRDQFRQFYQAFRSAFSDVHITLDNVIEAGDFVTCLARVDLVPRNGQGPVQICGSTTVRIRDGQLVEGWNYFDFLPLLVQLEVAPPDAMDRALASAAATPA